MAIKLSKYSQAQNIASTDSILNDNNTPFNFKDWLERNTGIIPGQEQVQYQSYVKEWYKNKEDEIPTRDAIKEDYKNLLKQLTLSFKSEADALWASNIDFDNPEELEQIIPFYATKLKEIAIYLINKREAVRRAKLKYNLAGTYTAVERLFYEYLLKAFTKRPFPGTEYTTNVTDVSVLNTLPELSAVNNNFQITIEELYDDASYFDRDPTLPASAYFTFNSDVTAYLDSLNITPSEYEWLYSTGVTPLCANNPLLWSIDNVLNQYKSGVPLSAVELYDSDVLNEYNIFKLSQKYLGESQYIVSGGYWTPWLDDVSFNLLQGNNWFYWLSGNGISKDTAGSSIDAISLTGSSLIESGATAGDSITAADIIFITRNNLTSGAWLRAVNTLTDSPIMSAKLNKGKTIFAYPFPGYGVSGEGLDWSGRSFDNLNQTFFYLDKPTQQAIYNAYWNTSVSSTSAIQPLYINDTTLINTGAKASNKFSEADYIAVRSNYSSPAQNSIFSGQQEYAWLYKMNKTDIPIAIGTNNVYWPFERFDTSISMVASSDQCLSVSLSSIGMQDFIGSVAGVSVDVSDRIFKKKSPNTEDYTEGAWLSGTPIPQPRGITSANILSGSTQPNFTIQVLGGDYGSFVWTSSTVSTDEVFKNIQHQKDCEYLKKIQFSLYKERPTAEKDLEYNQWQSCSCRSILYSPLGHPGSTFDNYDRMSDFIVAVSTPLSSFSLKDWRGIDNKSYETSNDFGWFKLNNQYAVEPDVGWGSGNWITNTGTSFTLSANVLYLYYRADMHRDDPSINVPYIITRYRTASNATWIKLYLNKDTGEWSSTDTITDMILAPSDIFTYIHPASYSFTLTSSRYEYTSRTVPVLPDFNNYNIVANLNSIDLPISSTSIPVQVISPNVTTDFELSTVDTISASYYGMPSLPITLSGSFNNILSTTVTTIVSTITTTITDFYTYSNNSTNFILNIPLSGWTYSDNTIGAKPYWAIASDNDDPYTKQKGIDIWAGSPVLVDDYNFVTQPPFSNIKIIENTYIEYNKRDSGIIVWKQPVSLTHRISEKQWCKIEVDKTSISNLSAILYNNTNEFTTSATNIISDITLYVEQDKPLIVNYFARNNFTWAQQISNSSLGLPPTGGVWIGVSSEQIITPDTPYAHLSNRHYPTYSTVPTVGELYSVKDSGGYMIPRLFGVSTALAKNLETVINTNNIDNNPSNRGATATYRDLNAYLSDRGLTQREQVEPVSQVSIDSSWMKADITEGHRAGSVVQAKQHQEFMPYQTQFESTGKNNNGIFRQGEDTFDPWFSDLDGVWENEADWPPNQRMQYDIAGWYEQQNIGDKQVYQWKTDIFGNQYAVLKDGLDRASIYDKKHSIGGSIWTRNMRNIIQPASASMSEVFDSLGSLLSGDDLLDLVTTSQVLDIDLWYDTMMIYTSSVLFFFRLSFDYDTGIISSIPNDITFIRTDDSLFSGTWFHENDKTVTICTLLSSGDQIRPVLRSLDINTSQMTYLYNITSDYTNMSNVSYVSSDHPVLTYDAITKTYNISYMGHNALREGPYFTTINLRNINDEYVIVSSNTLEPNPPITFPDYVLGQLNTHSTTTTGAMPSGMQTFAAVFSAYVDAGYTFVSITDRI
jgi:hypothetical protein